MVPPLVKGEDKVSMIRRPAQHFSTFIIKCAFIQSLTELEWLSSAHQFLKQFPPIPVAEEIIIPQIDEWPAVIHKVVKV